MRFLLEIFLKESPEPSRVTSPLLLANVSLLNARSSISSGVLLYASTYEGFGYEMLENGPSGDRLNLMVHVNVVQR